MKVSIKRTSACVVALGLALSVAAPVKAGMQAPMSPAAGFLLGAGLVAVYKISTNAAAGFAEGCTEPIQQAAGWVKKHALWIAVPTALLLYYNQGFRSYSADAVSSVVSSLGKGAGSLAQVADRQYYAPYVDNYKGYNTRFTTGTFLGGAAGAGFANYILDKKPEKK